MVCTHVLLLSALFFMQIWVKMLDNRSAFDVEQNGSGVKWSKVEEKGV